MDCFDSRKWVPPFAGMTALGALRKSACQPDIGSVESQKLTCISASLYNSGQSRGCLHDAQTNLPTPKQTPRQGARIPLSNARQVRTERPQEKDVQGPLQVDGLIGRAFTARVVDRPCQRLEPMERMSITRDSRLRKTSDFAAVRREGKSWADSRLVLAARPNRCGKPRFGFTVSKRLGNAVARNRIRRRLKAAAAHLDVEAGWDLVVIARQRAKESDYHALERSLRRLLARAKLDRPSSRASKKHSGAGRGNS